MTDEPDRISVTGKAARAKTELAETRAAFAHIRHVMLEEIVTTNPDHTRKLDRLVMGVQIIDGVRKLLERAVADGEVENYKTLLAEHMSLRPE